MTGNNKSFFLYSFTTDVKIFIETEQDRERKVETHEEKKQKITLTLNKKSH